MVPAGCAAVGMGAGVGGAEGGGRVVWKLRWGLSWFCRVLLLRAALLFAVGLCWVGLALITY